MEGSGSPGFDGSLMRKPRSSSSRRPRPDTPSSNVTRSPVDDSAVSHNGFRLRDFYLNPPALGGSTPTAGEGTKVAKKRNRNERPVEDVDRHGGSSRGNSATGSKRSTEGVLSPANWKSKGSGSSDSLGGKSGDRNGAHTSTDGHDSSEKGKPMKMKLKFGGVTHTLEPKPPRSADFSRLRQRHSSQDSGGPSSPSIKKDSRGTGALKSSAWEQDDAVLDMPSNEPLRKSSRVPKRRIKDEFDEYGALRPSERYRSLRADADDGVGPTENGEASAKKKNASKAARNRGSPYSVDEDFSSSKSNRDGRRRPRESSDDFIDDDEPASEKEPEVKNSKRKEPAEPAVTTKAEPLRTRRRALRESGKDANGDSVVEFPDGLPLPSSRKQRGKLSDVEIQAKKAEAAQRRRMQVEKAAKESEAEAIRKILGLDSDKKKEEKKQKEREEKEKLARSQRYTGSSIRWVMGPTGTVVSFPDDMGLPSIFNSEPCSYPPPREKCAGPACTNAYKYRDSKSNLPLCSLECYRAVQGKA